MRRSGTDVRLVIIGEGAERESLTRMVRQLDLEPWVLLPGYREKASAYMSRFDVFVLSSLTEGLPVTLLEAMRAGVPVVADSRGLAEKSSRLYHDPELRAELGRRGKDAIYGCYSSEIMERQYREIYSGVLERKAVRGESAMIHRPCPTVPERVTQS